MNKTPGKTSRVLGPVLLILVLINILLMTRMIWEAMNAPAPVSAAAPKAERPSVTPTVTSTAAPVFPSPQPGASSEDGLRAQGVMIFSMRDGGSFHLFAYHPQYQPLTRLTGGAWDDVRPAVSPDHTRLAFASNQHGFWDLYMMNLDSGQVDQLTMTSAYDGSPAWSPDGKWLAYESYVDDQLDIFLLSVEDPTQTPVQLTDDPAADFAPAWSANGQTIAFVSNRSGDEDIYLAQLDKTEGRFSNLSANITSRDTAPAWSADGRMLAWTAQVDGVESLMVWDSQQPGIPARAAASGGEAVWSPTGGALLARVDSPNATGISVTSTGTGLAALPYTALPGELDGMAWSDGTIVDHLAPRLANPPAAPAPLYQVNLTQYPINPAGRFSVVELKDVTAPYPLLHDGVDEAFLALRQDISARTGWDFLGSLENAFIPLTRPSAPGMEEDWQYTGRAISTSPVLIHAGWMAVSREDINGRTYWRVYLKARFQDGSQGRPLTSPMWDFNARYNDPKEYEQGGKQADVPAGYWIDFTGLARAYGWERLPALVNWLTYFPAARFNQFVMTEGLDWKSALFELYPPEAMATATPPVQKPASPTAAGPLPTSP